MKTVLKIRFKSLFAKAINAGMKAKEVQNLFTESINEVTGDNPKQKKPVA